MFILVYVYRLIETFFAASNVVNIGNSLYSLPANSFYENSNNLRTFATTPVTTTTSVPAIQPQPAVRQPPNTQGQGELH